MLIVASAYSARLGLCLYIYCLCFLLSCSMITPPNLLLLLFGGVTIDSQAGKGKMRVEVLDMLPKIYGIPISLARK
jgi:hypothetical protein